MVSDILVFPHVEVLQVSESLYVTVLQFIYALDSFYFCI